VGKKAIEGTPNSKPSAAYTVQLFSNPSGEDEGKTFVGRTIATTDGSGNASFSVKPPGEVAQGQNVTAAEPQATPPSSQLTRRGRPGAVGHTDEQ